MGDKDSKEVKEIRSMDFIDIREDEFVAISSLVYNHFGINLTDEKRTLVTGRLQKILRRLHLRSFKEYYDFVVADTSGEAISELVNVLSTNHTFFGREKDHFDFFQKRVLDEVVARERQAGSNEIRIWSAGCSTGEEPYTLAMLMMEYFGPQYKSWSAGVLATDISAQALEKAKSGIYTEDRLTALPDLLKHKYFRKLPDGDWEVREFLRQEVTFRRFNLMNAQFPFKKPFDVIFCRNVMIYFDNPTREALVDRFYDFTSRNGYLFIGHSETLKRETMKYKYIMPAVYKKVL